MTQECLPMPELRGGNLAAYQSRAPEQLCWGPAGTGKTVGGLFKLVHLAMIFPNTRWFVLRKTRASLNDSALLTLEQEVLGADSPVLTTRPLMRKTRDFYEFSNKSVIVPVGMDKPEKLFSVPFNGGYINELTELEPDEYQSLKRALRWPARKAVTIPGRTPPVPFYYVGADCNPSYGHHWVNQRMKSGVLTGFQSRHEDNPRFYDLLTKAWTADGREYIENNLQTLTGFMRQRLLDGIWAAAEGLVYDEFDERIHVLPATFSIPESWDRYWAIDWGYTDPLTLQFWAKDGDGRLYLYREFYKTGQLVEHVAQWAAEEMKMKREPRPKAVVCDHDPENAETFKKHTGLPYVLADKTDRKGGIQKVKSRLRVAGDGRPRIYIVRGCRTHPEDKALRTKAKPTTILDEIPAYVWNPDKDVPEDGDDHGADAMRYVTSHVDKGGGWGFR